MTTPAWISLGSNLGDRRGILDEALLRLGQTPGVVVVAVSSYHETLPVGGPAGQGRFLNAAARLDTTLSPRELLGVTQAIERDLGRVRAVRWGERTLDLDLLLFEGYAADEPDLRLPHPRLAIRRFVLQPLAEIAPDAVDVRTGRTVADLLANLDRRPHYLLLDQSVQIKVPRLLQRLVPLLPAVPVARRRAELRRSKDLPEIPDRVRAISQGRVEAIQEAAARCLQAGPKTWVLSSAHLPVRTSGNPPPAPEVSSIPEPCTSDEPPPGQPVADPAAARSRPTLIVAMPPPRRRMHQSVSTNIPIYWPEATEPDAILAEVVAVCRGIAEG